MLCPICHHEHPDDARFCPETGQRIEFPANRCPKCGNTDLPPAAKFCPRCGTPIKTVASATSNECPICHHALPEGVEGMKLCPFCGAHLSSRQSDTDGILTFTVRGVSFKMVKVEGGTFMMGANEDDSEAYDDEKPRHQVTLSSYYIGQTQVTQALWEAVMGSNPSYFKGDNLPVEQVSWNDCQAFICKLNALTGQQFCLPTEAEWEFAARNGNKSRGYKYSGSNNIDAVAWYYSNSSDKTHAVGTKQPNELGIYDMSGNVFEWCSDWKDTYPSSSQTNPTGSSSGSYRVFRGGSWGNAAGGSQVSYRGGGTPDFSIYSLGLRLSIHKVNLIGIFLTGFRLRTARSAGKCAD